MSECKHLFDKWAISGLREQWGKLPGTVSQKQGLLMVDTIEDLHSKITALESRLSQQEERIEVLQKALRKITTVSQFGRDGGPIVTSEHYEGAWLDCVDIAVKALAKYGQSGDGEARS